MDVAGYIVIALRIGLVLIVLLDVFLLVLHVDSEGLVAPWLVPDDMEIAWPFVADFYRTEPEMGDLTFGDALYYTGITVTVLGYGDITPLTGNLKILTFVMSGLGFALLTGVVTYLLNVISGTAERNSLPLQVRTLAGNPTAGAEVIIV